VGEGVGERRTELVPASEDAYKFPAIAERDHEFF
jgi:hypothetical protein